MTTFVLKGISGEPYHTSFSHDLLRLMHEAGIQHSIKDISWSDQTGDGGGAIIVETDPETVFLLFLKYPELVFRLEDLNSPVHNRKAYVERCIALLNRKQTVTL